MAGVIAEAYISRNFSLGKSARRELVYVVVGTSDETEVKSIVTAEAPAAYAGLAIDDISVENLGGGNWKATATYNRLSTNDEYTFNTGGGSARVTQSLATTAYPAPGLIAPDFEGAIGVSGDSVEGVDIVVPKFEFTETHFFNNTAVTQAYKILLAGLTGKVNSATFRGFDAGECLFLGASGQQRGDELWAITFSFECAPNVSGVTLGGIPDIDKRGQDYIWFRYEDFEDSGAQALVKRPTAAYVAVVYQDGDFSGLGI